MMGKFTKTHIAAEKKLINRKTTLTLDEYRKTELPLLSDIIKFSSNVPISIYSDTTIVKTPEACFRGVYSSRNRLLGEEFLLNFRRSEMDLAAIWGVKAYRSYAARAAMANRLLQDKELESNCIILPSPEKLNVPLGPVIRARRSVRRFSGALLNMKELSTLLFYCQGISAAADITRDIPGGFPASRVLESEYKNNLRHTPSGGALYPIDLYAIVNRVDELEKGVYRYLPNTHALCRMGNNDSRDFASLNYNLQGIDIDKINVYLAFVYNIFYNSRKYGDSGLAFAFIEAGEISQSIHLVSTAAGIGSCDIGGYNKQSYEKAIGVDGLSQQIFHLIVIGK